MPSDGSIQPLRISKNTPSSTPQKMAPSNRPLSEISAGSMRRNSPSYNQATKKMIVTREASPYTENSFSKSSAMWSALDHLDTENSFAESLRSPSPVAEINPRRRPSVERLQQASRVKNSKIFELENKATYDPGNTPIVERPSANRPQSQTFVNNSFTRFDSLRKENNPLRTSPQRGHKRSETEVSIPYLTPTKLASPNASFLSDRAGSPATGSPTKSSLARTNDERCPTPRAIHRQNKSVTFETSPPEINEYENQTPEPSVAASHSSREGSADSQEYYDEDSFEQGSFVDNDDSFDVDLENTDKTPVVLPEHWTNINAEDIRKNLIDDDDDVFESSVIHTAQHDSRHRSASVASDGSARPLPPLPGMLGQQLRKKESQRLLVPERAESEEIVVKNLDTGEVKEFRVSINEADVQDESVVAELEEFTQSPPRISRESILAKVRGSKYDFDDEDDDTFADATEDAHLSYSELAKFDPDQPVPSRENVLDSTIHLEVKETLVTEITAVHVKSEPEDSQLDLTDIPAAVLVEQSLPTSHFERQVSAQSELDDDVDDMTSCYSSTEPAATQSQEQPEEAQNGETLQDAMALLTVKDYSSSANQTTIPSNDFLGLPQYTNSSDWHLAMEPYCTPSPPADDREATPVPPVVDTQIAPEDAAEENAFVSAPILMPEPSLAATERAETPDSVIRRASDPVSDFASEEQPAIGDELHDMEADQYDGLHRPVSPVIPERRATIKTGGKLKARPSGTPADFESLFAAPDLEQEPMPAMPGAFVEEHDSRLDLDLPDLDQHSSAEQAGDMLGLDREFDRVIDNQNKGYLMRQNTKVVVASTRNVSGGSNDTITADHPRPGSGASPRKPSSEQHFKSEPWNGKQRRKSLRTASTQRANDGPAPPLPGQQSALGVVNEDRSLVDDTNADIERGRLFIKVVGVQQLDLPLPKNDRVDFKLTLDNGLHCVTTGALELGHSASIGQEFELVVQNDLEFQLTLSTRLPPPTKVVDDFAAMIPASSPTKSKSTFSRLLTSPKKRAEKERQEREAHEAEERRRKEELARKRASVQPTAWDLMRELVNANDGSFARAYVNLAEHEETCFGRKLEIDVPLYNEWALEKDDVVVNSVRSKRGANWGPVRRPPYIIGELKCQLLFVPKPKDATDEDMPKSMSSAVREISKASEIVEVSHEGFLSQQGGDCTHWRRRFFSVVGSKLTAYHEHTHQKRAVINLTKASRLVDDKSTLVAHPGAASKRSGRRKSAFAEEDEGYQYVEEGFRIRFANGETIDFYADSRAEKDVWMQTLAQVIGKPDQGARKQKWTDLVLAREKAAGNGLLNSAASIASTTEVRDFVAPPAPAPPAKDEVARKPVGSKSVPTSPLKRHEPLPMAPPPAKRPSTPPMQPRTGHRKRDAVRSMIF